MDGTIGIMMETTLVITTILPTIFGTVIVLPLLVDEQIVVDRILRIVKVIMVVVQ